MKTNLKVIGVLILALMLFTNIVNAQDQKKIKLKIIKEVDGKTTITDTVFVGKEFKEIDLAGLHITKDLEKIIENLEIGGNVDGGTKVYAYTIKESLNCDSLSHLWVELEEGMEKDHNSTRNAIFITGEGKAITSACKNMIFISGNDKDTLIQKGNRKIIIQDTDESDDDVMIWVTDSKDVKVIKDSAKIVKVEKIITKKGNEDEIQLFISSDEESDKGNDKTYNVIVKSSGDGSYTTIVSDKKDIDIRSDKHAYVYTIRDDGAKATVKIRDLDEKDEKILADIKKGIKAENQLKDFDLKLTYNIKANKISIEFDVKPKSNVNVNIFDNTGESSFSDEKKGFNGNYKKEIDLGAGEYFIQIGQDKKTTTKRLIIK